MTTEHSVVPDKLQAAHDLLKKGFNSGQTKSLASRLQLLNKLESLVVAHQDEICDALKEDLGRPVEDSIIAELGVVIEELHSAKKSLKKWMAPQRLSMPLTLFPSRGYIASVPFGVTLIIGPWNYPIQLLLAPMVAAIAAGNCVMLKPSELTPRCAELLDRLIPCYFSNDVAQVSIGGIETSQQLLELKWDFIFFTGSTHVGKIVAQAASKHLTPVVLELGGKSPCIVDSTANLEVTARRILWGKTLNAGQTCVAPDYILTPKNNVEPLIASLKKTLDEFYPEGFIRGKTYCGIVNQNHFERLSSIAAENTKFLRLGGKTQSEMKMIEPSIYVLEGSEARSNSMMKEEIFGPILPIIIVESVEEAIEYIKKREHPLTIYVFSNDQRTIALSESETQSGSLVVNDTVIQLATSQLPFGGVGASGYGAYHGITGFKTFSHQRSILKRPFWLDIPVRYRPFAAWKIRILRKLINFGKSAKQPFPVPRADV